MNSYLQPHYKLAHDAEERGIVTNIDLGGDYGLTHVVQYTEDESGFKARIPQHFHLESIDGNNSIAIRLDKAEYFMDGRNFDKLTPEQCIILDTELRKINESDPYRAHDQTYWETMRWFSKFHPKRIRGCYVRNQPDYTKLK